MIRIGVIATRVLEGLTVANDNGKKEGEPGRSPVAASRPCSGLASGEKTARRGNGEEGRNPGGRSAASLGTAAAKGNE